MMVDKQTKKSQSDKFIETAREIGADEDEAAFKKKLAKIVKAKPVQKNTK